MAVDREASEVAITSGVTQVSVLRPIFFMIYINNMAEYTKHSSVKLFADTTIIYVILTAGNNCKNLQEDHHASERWEADWMMAFHPDKCSVIRITRKKEENNP